MSKALVIGLDLVALGSCIAYWEWRHQTYGWGRGWMHEPEHRLGLHEWIALFPGPFDERWDFDLPLPAR